MNQFNNDLQVGQESENTFINFLKKQGLAVTSTQDQGRFSGYDVKAVNTSTNQTFTFEVKKDVKSAKTGRVAVELYGYDSNGNKKPSGLEATTADFYVYTFPDDNNFYITETSTLKKRWHTCGWYSKLRIGDGYGAENMLINKDDFISDCRVVNSQQ